MLLSDVLGVPLALLIPLINLPFIALGYRQVGGRFALKSAAAIAGLSVCLALVHFPDVTPDKAALTCAGDVLETLASENARVLVLVDGTFAPQLSNIAKLDKGLTIRALRDVTAPRHESLRPTRCEGERQGSC